MVSTAEFFCSCESDMVRVFCDEHGFVEFAFWTYGQPRAVRWQDRFRWIWRVLRHGEPFGDQLLLKPEEAARLGSWLRARVALSKPVD